MADETKQVDVLLGPYRNQRLTMSAADADAAVNAHWAQHPNLAYDPDHEPHDPLTDQQRQDAMTAAHTWAQATWETAQGTAETPPPPEGTPTKRAMEPDKGADYKTRQAHPEPKKS